MKRFFYWFLVVAAGLILITDATYTYHTYAAPGKHDGGAWILIIATGLAIVQPVTFNSLEQCQTWMYRLHELNMQPSLVKKPSVLMGCYKVLKPIKSD